MYVKIGLSLSQNQKEKIKHAFQKKTGLTLQFSFNQLNGSYFLGVTKIQLKKINEATSRGSV